MNPTMNLYDIQEHLRHQQGFSQQQQYCDPSSASDIAWEHKKMDKAPYMLSPPEDDAYAYRHQNYLQASHMYPYDKPEYYPELKQEEDYFIDSSIHRSTAVNMPTREENVSQTSSSNTVPSSSSGSLKRKSRGKQSDSKNEAVCKKIAADRDGIYVEKKRYRRESHNAVERRRRNNINDNIRSLGQLLPDTMREGKLNKGSILKGSVVYINMLNEQLLKYKERLELLQYEAAHINTTQSI